jgi:hypothetical protein
MTRLTCTAMPGPLRHGQAQARERWMVLVRRNRLPRV